jgi:CheY-like chemotaxis protein
MIFEKFQQIDSSLTRTRGGLGLGLAICREISDLLEGRLRVESALNKGSSFYFDIPLNPAVNISGNTPDFNLHGRCFLVVEDVESNYLYLEKLLTDSGAEVIWAQTGKEAISLASGMDSIDMVLMDIRMPDMNGYDITREIKKIKPSLTVIAQTAYAMKSDEKDAFDAGCSAHISKPIKIPELKKIISQYLEIPEEKRMLI